MRRGLARSLFIGFMVFGARSSEGASLIYVPEGFVAQASKMVVVIHGCLQTPESMALGTGWNQLADRNNLVILYPQVPTGTNPMDCWGWYDPKNQRSDSGQLQMINNEVKAWKRRLKINKAPVFVAGISSGAAMTAGLLACFPSEYAAGAIHSGPSYGTAQSLKDGERVLRDGPGDEAPPKRACNPGDFQKPVMVVQGTADVVVHPKNIEQIVSDYFESAVPSGVSNGTGNGLKFKISDYKIGSQLRGRVVEIEGLGHAWAGYTENLRHAVLLGPSGPTPTHVPFFSPQGPSSTNLIFKFFETVLADISDLKK